VLLPVDPDGAADALLPAEPAGDADALLPAEPDGDTAADVLALGDAAAGDDSAGLAAGVAGDEHAANNAKATINGITFCNILFLHALPLITIMAGNDAAWARSVPNKHDCTALPVRRDVRTFGGVDVGVLQNWTNTW
jgi:hypothetical protein